MILSLPRFGKIDPCETCGGVANHFAPCVFRCYGCDQVRLKRYPDEKYCGGCEEADAHDFAYEDERAEDGEH